MKNIILIIAIMFLSLTVKAEQVNLEIIKILNGKLTQLQGRALSMSGKRIGAIRIKYLNKKSEILGSENNEISEDLYNCFEENASCVLDKILLNPSFENEACRLEVSLLNVFGKIVTNNQVYWGNCQNRQSARAKINVKLLDTPVENSIGRDLFGAFDNKRIGFKIENSSIFKNTQYIESLFVFLGRNGEVLDVDLFSFSELDSNQSKTFSTRVIRPSLWSRLCSVKIFVDSSNLLHETNEEDNQFEESLGDCNNLDVDYGTDFRIGLTRTFTNKLIINYTNFGSEIYGEIIPLKLETFDMHGNAFKSFELDTNKKVMSFGETELLSLPLQVQECFIRVSIDPSWVTLDQNRNNNIEILNFCNN